MLDSKQNATDSMSMIAALAWLGQQTSHSLQSLCLISCNAIYYYAGFYSQFLIFQKETCAKMTALAFFTSGH